MIENEKSMNSNGEVDIYYQSVEVNDDELRNMAENPRALTEDFKEQLSDVKIFMRSG